MPSSTRSESTSHAWYATTPQADAPAIAAIVVDSTR